MEAEIAFGKFANCTKVKEVYLTLLIFTNIILKRKVAVIFFLFSLPVIVFSQEPAHFNVGAEALADVDIYDIIQDKDHNYWLATDNGIIQYDGYRFKTIVLKSMVDKSVFGWKADKNKNLYCYNLSGQIFSVINGVCSEFIKIPDSLVSNEMSFEFNMHGQMIIAAKVLLKVEADSALTIIHNSGNERTYYTKLFKKKNGILLTQEYSNQEFLSINDQVKVLTKHDSDNGEVLSILNLSGSYLYFDKVSTKVISFEKDSIFNGLPIIKQKKSGQYRLHSSNKYLFACLPTSGFQLFTHHLKPLYQGEILLENELISDVYEDHEGNIILGTFKGGLFVIPEMKLSNYNLPLTEQNLTAISSSDKNIYVGTQGGQLFDLNKRNNKLSLLRKGRSKSIEKLAYLRNSNQLLIDNLPAKLINLSNLSESNMNVGSIKDIEYNREVCFISSNNGIYIHDPSGLFDFKEQGFPLDEVSANNYVLRNFNQRTYCVNYDWDNQIFYAGTSTGLQINDKKSFKYFRLNNQQLNCTDIKFHNGNMYVATQGSGILVFKGGKIIDLLDKQHGLLSNAIYAIQFYNKQLYVATDVGFQILNDVGETVNFLGKSEGLDNNKVIDFWVGDNQLWLMQQKRLQVIAPNDLEAYKFVPEIKLAHIIQENDTVNELTHNNIFNASQSRFEFQLRSPTLRHQENITYKYQLVGIDTEWQEQPYKNNHISYVSLPAGNYTFNAKAVCRNIESAVVSYSFTVKPPYYNTWWFYLLSILFVLTVCGALFTVFYLRQKKQIQFQNELNQSKLSAIQSQMNPHFIFNALNSIQDFIVLNEKRLAARYLGKFADLMRIYLNHSQVKTVSLHEEVEALSLYLELEKLRFEALDFSIEIQDRLERHLIAIPSLIIQPYVENALKHGLLHKVGAKQLSISFKQNREKDILICVITDNGIGRAASSEINKMRDPKHQSFATKATRNRLDLLNYGSDKPLSAEIIDLFDESDVPNGTMVRLNIPIIE